MFGTFQLFPPLSTRHRHDDTTPGRDDMKGRLGGDEDATTTRVGMGCRAHPHKNGSFFFVNTFIYLLTPTLSSPAVLPPPPPLTLQLNTVVLFQPHPTLQPETRTRPIWGRVFISGCIPSTRTPPTCPNRHVGGVSRFSTPPSSQRRKRVPFGDAFSSLGYIPSTRHH